MQMSGPFEHLLQQMDRAWTLSGDGLAAANLEERVVSNLALRHADAIRADHWNQLRERWRQQAELAPGLSSRNVVEDFVAYIRDTAERSVLFTDVLRQRGNSYVEREAEGFKPVLVFDFETVVDGSKLQRPVNYSLVRIKPPPGSPPQQEDARPFVIIDPRAGHGSGIGGFKSDSEVGVALREGFPVYFVIFRPDPEPGQTIADVRNAEAEFLKEVVRRHPNSPKPLVTGNCQGGWAAMLLAATNPDLPGPIVIAGAPLSYWAGTNGRHPMRYTGGLLGGALPALVSSDLGAGRFDGANLVLNFENLNPGGNWWKKYYDLYSKVDTEEPRFLEFEHWWSGFYFMTEAEICWIVETLFVGNKLVQGTAVADDGQVLDLRRITSPIVVFASHGDNITPPEQALQWIADLYRSTDEIVARGQVIIYTLHDTVGHLGIFVSAGVAKKQHKEITSTVKMIEALSPGLYEMVLEERPDRMHVTFEPRQISDIQALGDGDAENAEFAAVARLSEWTTEAYEMFMRPWVRACVTPAFARALTTMHPLRQQRYVLSDQNPLLSAVGGMADQVRKDRHAAAADNPFVRLEHLRASAIEQAWDFYRDVRDAGVELMFHSIYGNPMMQRLAKASKHTPDVVDPRQIPEVQQAIEKAGDGGYVEAVIRMLVLAARGRGSVRRSRLERSNAILESRPPFSTLSAADRSRIIHEQTLIVEFEPQEAALSLPGLIPDVADRQRAIDLLLEVAGPIEEMSAPTVKTFEQLQSLLGVKAAGWRTSKPEAKADGKPPAAAVDTTIASVPAAE
jgi:pimeloyl-ACP methyl ester carboxylesterase